MAASMKASSQWDCVPPPIACLRQGNGDTNASRFVKTSNPPRLIAAGIPDVDVVNPPHGNTAQGSDHNLRRDRGLQQMLCPHVAIAEAIRQHGPGGQSGYGAGGIENYGIVANCLIAMKYETSGDQNVQGIEHAAATGTRSALHLVQPAKHTRLRIAASRQPVTQPTDRDSPP